jgi:recombinational DNA repair ATPase RecF
MKITKVQINKYKSYESSQQFAVDPSVTVLVGKNEAGKTAILEAIAKTNYFTEDKSFKFDPVHDYPRKEKKKYDKAGEVEEVTRITYAIDPELRERIDREVGKGILTATEITVATKYDNTRTIIGLDASAKRFLEQAEKLAA